MHTGITAVDALTPVGCGQSMLLLGSACSPPPSSRSPPPSPSTRSSTAVRVQHRTSDVSLRILGIPGILSAGYTLAVRSHPTPPLCSVLAFVAAGRAAAARRPSAWTRSPRRRWARSRRARVSSRCWETAPMAWRRRRPAPPLPNPPRLPSQSPSARSEHVPAASLVPKRPRFPVLAHACRRRARRALEKTGR